MAPINLPGGSQVSEIVLPDGSTASEVIAPDGSTVFGAIPDSANLHARYDARNLSLTDGAEVSSWPDEVASADLSIGSGSPTYVANGINGVPAVSYDGDRHDASFASSISDPYSVFFSGQLQTRNSNSIAYSDNPVPGSGFVGLEIANGFGSYEWKVNGTGDPTLSTNDTNPHIFSNIFASGTGELRVDSSKVASKNASSDSNDLNGISLAERSDGNAPADILITEVLVYSVDESANQTDIETYLDRDLGLI